MWRKYRVSDKGYSSVLLGIGHYLSPGGGRGGAEGFEAEQGEI